MTAPTRRAFLTGAAASLITAPAIVRVASLDRVRGVVVGFPPPWTTFGTQTGRWSSNTNYLAQSLEAARQARENYMRLLPLVQEWHGKIVDDSVLVPTESLPSILEIFKK